MLYTIDNIFVSLFSSNVPPFICLGTTRGNSLHCVYNFLFHNERSLIDRTSYHILSDKFCSIPSLLTLIYYYIVILLLNNIYWSTSSSLFLVCDNIFTLADFDPTSSLRRRSRLRFLLQIKICSANDNLFLSYVVSLSFHSLLCCVFSPVCWGTCVSWCDCWSMICWWRLSFLTIGQRACAHQ